MKITLSSWLHKNEPMSIVLLLGGLFLFFMWLLLASEGYIGDADGLTHYKFSRYSWLYPEFLLHHWGKPVFTLLSSPFAQFGYDGVSVFNLLAGMASGWFAWLSARRLGYSNRLLLPFLLFFAPVYTLFVISGQVEVLFGLFIVATAYLCLDKKYLWAAVLISFSPLVRTEGIIMIPVFGLFFLAVKQYRAIPWLLTGSVIYSIIGYFHYDDLFWLVNQMPYRGTADAYGTGSLAYFFLRAPKMFGWLISLLITAGMVMVIREFQLRRSAAATNAFLLILLPFAVYFLAHVVMWYTGIGRSLGLHRYMVSIVPLGALLALRGYNAIIDLFRVQRHGSMLSLLFTLFLLLTSVSEPFSRYQIPHELDGMNKVMKEAADYMQKEGLDEHKIYYYDPAFFYFLNLNPYNETQSRPFVYRAGEPHYNIEPGEIVIWDGHFSPIHHLEFKDLAESPHFETIKVFEPEVPFRVFDTRYRVGVFQRVAPD
ncbi:MAG: glycosyltransferase family 87 protein [Bacteroidales bacterium]